MYYKCVKFHKNPISRLGGVVLTRYMDGWTDGQTDRQDDSYIPGRGMYHVSATPTKRLIEFL
jgi:hypothetical protein